MNKLSDYAGDLEDFIAGLTGQRPQHQQQDTYTQHIDITEEEQ